MVHLVLVWLLVIQTTLVSGNTDTSPKSSEQGERMGRSWFSSLAASQHKQNPSFPPSSTSKPGTNVDSSVDNGGRTFEEQDKTAPAASEQDFLSRHYGYFNVHRFDPNLPYYENRQPYPRYPSPHTPRFGPGYRKDKYGHGYGYSCKHGDDCDEVRAANQIPLRLPPNPVFPPHHGQFPHHNSPPTPYNSAFVDASAFSNMPPYPGVSSFPPFSAGGLYPPARFNDPHLPLPHQMPPNRFYHGRYLHDQEDSNGGLESSSAAPHEKTEIKSA